MINQVDYNNQTPLMLAADIGDIACVKLLLNHAADRYGLTAFDYAPTKQIENIINKK